MNSVFHFPTYSLVFNTSHGAFPENCDQVNFCTVIAKVHIEELKTPWFCFENSQLTAQPNWAEEGSKY